MVAVIERREIAMKTLIVALAATTALGAMTFSASAEGYHGYGVPFEEYRPVRRYQDHDDREHDRYHARREHERFHERQEHRRYHRNHDDD